MSLLQRIIFHRRFSTVFLCLLGGAYLLYVAGFGQVLSSSLLSITGSIRVDQVETNSGAVLQYWTPAHMNDARSADVVTSASANLTQQSSGTAQAKAVQQQGQPPKSGDATFYPLSTVGKVFFTNGAGQDFVCSGTAVTSANDSVVDTAGHCLYMYGTWMQKVVFCPRYESGDTPYGCWAARDLEVPADWVDAPPGDYHHDFGMAIVAPNNAGALTDLVGGAGWAYNQPVNQLFSAYGYPAGYPFDGQTRQSCKPATGMLWPHGAGTVVSIPCDMTGGSSGGPWFIQANNSLFIDGHNDFISSLQRDHMFSPYYDNTWYALYNKAQHT